MAHAKRYPQLRLVAAWEITREHRGILYSEGAGRQLFFSFILVFHATRLTCHQTALQDGRLASSPSPCHHLRMRRSSKTAKQTSPTEQSPYTIEGVARRGTSPRLSRVIEPEGDWDQLDLATGDVDLTTAAGIDVGGGSQAEYRDNRDRRSRSSGTQPQSLHHDALLSVDQTDSDVLDSDIRTRK